MPQTVSTITARAIIDYVTRFVPYPSRAGLMTVARDSFAMPAAAILSVNVLELMVDAPLSSWP